ncbi:integrase family protein [Pseudoalteromonas carrageenovora]|uniref:gamma-mobile-trio integrase GmtZ n=1 Tax=Pseudoalteromonas carrageenovora TaxID=227 RepID=UPI0021175B5E|nr:integrase family protein [Pseudoalteromonas carrageenovora]MCQ8888262.1 integrase family protein [Pseudoalteromonas carrageenovora]
MNNKIDVKKRDSRASDTTFSWMLTTFGPEWESWQKLASEWMKTQQTGVGPKQVALTRFFETYLYEKVPYAVDIKLFFSGFNGHKCSTEEFEKIIRLKVNQPAAIQKSVNVPCDFIDFVIKSHLSEKNDNGILIPTVVNPIKKIKIARSITETVRNPLPYRYIQDLRQIICPLPSKQEITNIEESLAFNENLKPLYHYRNFSDWTWSHNIQKSDWFEVDEELIDKSDPDCVWRMQIKKKKEIFQIWSPVRHMILLVKLHLPLRTYQINMLDSGEADTWRYENKQWKLNKKHDFSLGNEKRPFSKGVFRRVYDSISASYSTAIYINTNKSADNNKEELERGYTIPWQNEEVLYWLEKLRNWQEKYNPILNSVDCTTLLNKHTSDQKKSEAQLRSMGDISFLFRDASASGDDKFKPTYPKAINRLWYQLLLKLEGNLERNGDTLDNGEKLKLVSECPPGTLLTTMTSTYFPLHSLRVSLITAYTMDTQLPIAVISKMLAGHSRLLMTIYYNKITPSVFAHKMEEAELELEKNSTQSVKSFLKDASLEQIQLKMSYHKDDSIEAALVNRAPIGWEERATGLCLVGGNTVKSNESGSLGGCWNGGEELTDATHAQNRVYSAVPHGPENCIRCRWFISEARYLPALNAQFNQLSYKAHQAAKLFIEIEGELDHLKDEIFFAEEQGKLFTKHNEVQVLQRRYEKQKVEADEYTKDWMACFELINKIIRIEETRAKDDNQDKLIAVGEERDVSKALRFIETKSELLHLSLLCEDAEFYPDLRDELRKTPAIQKRSMELSRVLMKSGFEPVLMEMDENQQLIAANAMMRKMAMIADPKDKLEGYRKVASHIEAEEYLVNNKLLSVGISVITDNVISLNKLLLPSSLRS